MDAKISLTAAVSLAWMLVATAANMCRAAGTDGVCSQLRGQFADLDKLTVRYADAVAARARTNDVAVWRGLRLDHVEGYDGHLGGVLCEGSGITATDGRYEVATSVEQAMAASNAGVVYRRPDASCFRNGAITYTVYAPAEEIRFELADRTGDYSTFMRAHIPTPVSGKVFSLRILHGKCPKGASYPYRIDTGAFEGRQL